MADPSLAVAGALKASVEAALPGVSVYDFAPVDDAPWPHITIGDDTVTGNPTKTEDGHEVEAVIHAWSRAGSRSEGRGLLATLYDTLHLQPLTVPGFSITEVQCLFTTSYRDPDDTLCWHSIARYRVLVTS